MTELFCWMRGGVHVALPVTELPDREVMIAALARMLRWRGVWQRPISVARHSALVCLVTRALGGSALAGLLHDYHEAIIGDKPSPVLKLERSIMPSGQLPHDVLAAQIDQLVCAAWGLPEAAFKQHTVRRADMIVACAEAVACGVAPISEVKKFFGPVLWDETLAVMAEPAMSAYLDEPWDPIFDTTEFHALLRRCERGLL